MESRVAVGEDRRSCTRARKPSPRGGCTPSWEPAEDAFEFRLPLAAASCCCDETEFRDLVFDIDCRGLAPGDDPLADRETDERLLGGDTESRFRFSGSRLI
jgi:hypothetical protein